MRAKEATQAMSVITPRNTEPGLAARQAGAAPGKASSVRRIVYVGDTFAGCTSEMRLETLRGLGHSIHVVPCVHPPQKGLFRAFSRALSKVGYPQDFGVNQAILAALFEINPDVLWCDRPLEIKPDTLKTAKAVHPRTKIVAYSLDDMLQTHNQSAFYLRSIPLYDLHVTTKSHNISELAALGAKRVLFVDNAFSSRVHFPMALTPQEKLRYGGPVGFVGTYERERAEMLVALAEQEIPVRVWGGSWPNRLRSASANLRIEGRELWGDFYRLAVNSFDINLGFLRKINRDVQTTRSVEIPACASFLLAERTEEHRALFQEDVESAYFSSTEELIRKVKYYLANGSVRTRIALRGFRRAAPAYAYEAQLQRVLAEL